MSLSHDEICTALAYGWKGAQWSLTGTDWDGAEWDGPGDKPTMAELEAAFADASLPDLVAYAAHKRWECEVGGTVWNEWPVHTDRESQGKIVAERLAIEAGVRDDPDGWKFADGTFRMVTNVEFVAMADAVRNHVRQCFATEAQVLAGIAGGQITTPEQIDAEFAS